MLVTMVSHFVHMLTIYMERHKLGLREFIQTYNHGKVFEPELDECLLRDQSLAWLRIRSWPGLAWRTLAKFVHLYPQVVLEVKTLLLAGASTEVLVVSKGKHSVSARFGQTRKGSSNDQPLNNTLVTMVFQNQSSC